MSYEVDWVGWTWMAWLGRPWWRPWCFVRFHGSTYRWVLYVGPVGIWAVEVER